MIMLVLFATLFVCIFIGVPICFSLAISAFVCLLTFEPQTNMVVLPQRLFVQADNYVFMAVPFFMLAGELMLRGGLSKRLVKFVQVSCWRIPANLACVTTVASAFFGAISGSNPATVSAIGGMMCPEMKKDGYPDDVAGAIAAASGTLGVIIPPSIPMVIYGIASGQSVQKLFIAGFIPGILLAFVLCLTNIWLLRKVKENRKAKKAALTAEGYTGWRTFKQALGAIMMPVIILGGIYGGIFTPTEAGVVSVIYAFAVSAFVYHELNWEQLKDCLYRAGLSTGTILIVVACCAPFAWFMTSQGIPGQIAEAILSVVHSKFLIILAMNIILLFLGCFLDTGVIILLVTPIFLPLANAIGLHPIALGIIMVMNTSVGMITPPMAVNLYIATRVSGAKIEAICTKIIPFLITESLFVIIISNFSGLLMWLPNLIG